jgi:aminomethyltransferase
MLSYHADADINTNPFELGLERLINLNTENEFIGKKALKDIKEKGVQRIQVGLILNCDRLEGPNTSFWPVTKGNTHIGKVTSAVYSPRLDQNIALAMVSIGHSKIGTELTVEINSKFVDAKVVEKPFYDPKKSIAAKAKL